jgi:hypothetical protein
VAFEKEQDLQFHDQGGFNALSGGCSTLSRSNAEIWPLFLAGRCQHCWNDGHFFMQLSLIMRKKQMAFQNQQDFEFMTKGATTRLPVVVASSVGPMQRSGCSFFLGDANIVGMAAIFSCQFHEKKTKWLLKTNTFSNFMTQEASTPFSAAVASLACVTWR